MVTQPVGSRKRQPSRPPKRDADERRAAGLAGVWGPPTLVVEGAGCSTGLGAQGGVLASSGLEAGRSAVRRQQGCVLSCAGSAWFVDGRLLGVSSGQTGREIWALLLRTQIPRVREAPV